MKHGPSLEDERRALLDQIHARREAYRRMLMEAGAPEGDRKSGMHSSKASTPFPRSATIRWIKEHPYLCAAAVITVAIAAPRIARGIANRSAAMRRDNVAVGQHAAANQGIAMNQGAPRSQRATMSRGASLARTVVTSLTALAAMVLRDPSKMRMAARVYSTGAAYLRRRRQRQFSESRQF